MSAEQRTDALARDDVKKFVKQVDGGDLFDARKQLKGILAVRAHERAERLGKDVRIDRMRD